MKKSAIACLLFLTYTSLSLANTPFPKGCEQVGYHFDGDELILNEDNEQTLYFIENNSNYRLQLKYDEKRNVFMSVGWQTVLNKKKWAAFASDTKAQHFQCSIKDKKVRCHTHLRVCQYPRVKFAMSNMGSYWVATNVSLWQAKRTAIKKGILLRW